MALVVAGEVGPLKYAEQFAVVPLFVPAQLQYHGPVPVKLDAAPLEQRLVMGVVV